MLTSLVDGDSSSPGNPINPEYEYSCELGGMGVSPGLRVLVAVGVRVGVGVLVAVGVAAGTSVVPPLTSSATAVPPLDSQAYKVKFRLMLLPPLKVRV